MPNRMNPHNVGCAEDMRRDATKKFWRVMRWIGLGILVAIAIYVAWPYIHPLVQEMGL